jgi:tRNA threonylcarbamoyladenosine biosynthesis protein TsaB
MGSPVSILALDATTSLCSVAWTNGSAWIERVEDAGQRHSELIIALVDSVLREARCGLGELTEIAFGAGPGSFTGLRIASGIAQGLGYGRGLPVRAVSSLLALAQSTKHDAALVAIDARMNEVYWAIYRRDAVSAAWRTVTEPAVSAPADVAIPSGDEWVAAGDGLDAYPSLGSRVRAAMRVEPAARITARAVAELALGGHGRSGPAAAAIPHYVRDKVALTAAERAGAH